MADTTSLSLPSAAWAALGAAAAYLGKWILGAIQAGKVRENAAKDETIDELRAAKAVLTAENTRLLGVVDVLGKKYDAERDKREKTELMFAAHVIKTDDYEDLPSKVQTIALTVDPSKLTPPR